ncbi:peptidoglycan DD-metalloendopeptidase family protein [Nostoc ellipsosporum NOK]|jgi:septal ring factor EnvC (AmiA/AmiB activator)|nr:peptidoglycan DD-metalloendopeptidase family protein [Nostoc ellipsosporum NOK]
MQKKALSLLLFFSAVFSLASAQPLTDKTALEKERQELQKELREMQQAYDKVKGQTRQNLGQITLLNRKISLQEQYINNINKEVKLIDDDIYLSNLEIYRLQKQLDTLKEQYSRSVVYAYKNRASYNYLNFIFSSTSFNDALRRIAYLKEYRAYQQKQAKIILEHTDLIARRQEQQKGRKQQKQNVLVTQTSERNVLAEQRKEKDAVIAKLRTQEKDLKKQIASKQKRDRELRNAVAAIVKREIEAARVKAERDAKAKAAADKAEADRAAAARRAAEANNPNTKPGNPIASTTPAKTTPAPATPAPAKSYLDLNATDVKLNSSFVANKGQLPWPVDNGVVTIGYGPYKIEGIGPDVRGENPGLTMATPVGSAVKAIFEGEVVGVFSVDDKANITIRHGKYFTTYCNLSGATVSKGAQVSRGQVIGRAAADDETGDGKIDFILMIESRTVDPRGWLRR